MNFRRGRNTDAEANDYVGEMPRSNRLDHGPVDSLLSGRVSPGCDDLADVARFVEVLGATASAPTRPNVELAAVLAEGFCTDTSVLPMTAGSNVYGPAPQETVLPKTRIRKMLEIALAKLAGLGLAAKAGAASAAVVVATTGAGATGVLPAPAQEAVADVVGAVTPFEFPPSADANAEFGQRVSTDATDPDEPGVHGPGVADTASHGRSSSQDNAEDAGQPEDPDAQSWQGLDRADDNGKAADNLPSHVPGSSQTGVQQSSQHERAAEGGDHAGSTGRQTGDSPASGGQQTGGDDAGRNRP